MIRHTPFALIATLALATSTTSTFAADYTAMREDTRIHTELLGAAVANVIDENCEDLGLRKFRIFNQAMALQAHARSLGYSYREIMAYVESKSEQARFRKMADAVLAKKGARKGNAESYCAVGRAEMEKGTYTGKLLND